MTRPLGDFNYQASVGTYEPALSVHQPTNRFFGVDEQVFYLYGGWRDASGHLHIFERKFIGPMSAGLWLMHMRSGTVELDPASVNTVRGEVKREITDDRLYYSGSLLGKAGGAPEENFEFEMTADTPGGRPRIRWKEGTTLEMTGTSAAPGIQIFAADSADPFLYTTEIYKVTGTVLGEEVEGFVFCDHGYWPAGKEWKEWVIFNNYQVAWTAFAGELANGEIEWGQICIGRDGFNFMIICDQDGAIVADVNTTGGVDMDEDGWAPRIAYKAGDGRIWTFDMAPNGQLGQFSNARWGSYKAEAGTVSRVGDTREEHIRFAWGEYLLDRVNEEGLPTAETVLKSVE